VSEGNLLLYKDSPLYRVHDNKILKTGYKTKYWCSQDASHKKKSKKSTNPDAKQRETVGMKRFDCHSSLIISCHSGGDSAALDRTLYINLRHQAQHIHYYDVSMPAGAAALIREHVEWATPADMVTKIQREYPNVSRAQVHETWKRMSEVFWRRDDKQTTSAFKLLSEFPDDVDMFTPRGVPEGVEIMCWGLKNVAQPLKEHAEMAEVALDATCENKTYLIHIVNLPPLIDNTNSRNLELYCILTEHDNAGFPILYCFLSTASSIEIGKRKIALTAWVQCVRDAYGVNPDFAHVDKDMAEIAALRTLWGGRTKISLCWWHLRRAVRTRLASTKITTTPYDAKRAKGEFSFIDVTFRPYGRSDRDEYEGGFIDDTSPSASPEPTPNPSRLTVRLPNVIPLGNTQMAAPEQPPLILESQPRLMLRIPRRTAMSARPDRAQSVSDDEMSDDISEEKNERRTFCSQEHREKIVNMMERHYNAHPLIPGYCHPSKDGIKYWAVNQMYNYCVEHDLRELWAYLWENWYCAGRWELWARSAHPTMIPKLKTTMICESQ
jgi:hypothetical protein